MNPSLTPLDPFLVGLSPYLWAHIPLTIQQIHDLYLIEGLHCLVWFQNPANDVVLEARPIMKCRLLGTIVSVERRRNCVMYVIDDGTAVIDCLCWVADDMDENALVPLLSDGNDNDPSSTMNNSQSSILAIGELVQVHGRIDCSCLLEDTSRDPSSIHLHGKEWKIRQCVREIRASLIQPIPNTDQRYVGAEKCHWEDVMKTHHEMRQSAVAGKSGDLDNSDPKFLDACQIVNLLGPRIQEQICDLSNLPSSDDHAGAWQIFGLHCRCQTHYKDKLLYCHCMATPLVSDPDLVYRDAVLCKLMELEERQANKEEPFRFQFSSIVNDSDLVQIAKRVSREGDLGTPTFRALRADRVVFLLDAKSDTYLLLSRQRAIESFLTNDKRKPPMYWSSLSKQRIQYVKRLMHQQYIKLSTTNE